jgi:nucleotide-binding universal stress UspA family protein
LAIVSRAETEGQSDMAALAERGYDLVVLSVNRRPGDLLFFGNTAAAVLEKSPTSNLFVAS